MEESFVLLMDAQRILGNVDALVRVRRGLLEDWPSICIYIYMFDPFCQSGSQQIARTMNCGTLCHPWRITENPVDEVSDIARSTIIHNGAATFGQR